MERYEHEEIQRLVRQSKLNITTKEFNILFKKVKKSEEEDWHLDDKVREKFMKIYLKQGRNLHHVYANILHGGF